MNQIQQTETLPLAPTPAAKPAAIDKPKVSAIAVMAERVQCDPQKLLATLKNTVFQKASDDEMLALVVVANEYRLNPFLKEIYAFPAKGGGIVPVISVDGWIKLINSHPQNDGVEFEFSDDEAGNPHSCTCRLHIKGRSKPVVVTEFYAECFRKTEPWQQMPRRMLRHKALIQAARIAFGFSGVQDEDEARGFENAKPAQVVSVTTARPDFKQLESAPVIQEVVP
jgi:phage recombination protein Bet